MTKIFKYKPYVFLLGFIVVLAIAIILFKLWVDLTNDHLEPYGFMIIVTGCMGFYFFWIYILCYGFNMLEKMAWSEGKKNKSGMIILIAFITSLIGYTAFFYFHLEFNQILPGYINIPFSLITMFCFIYIIIYLTKSYSFYDRKTSPRIFDYFITMLLLCFVPFGLLIMHSHLRLILKEKSIIT